MSEERKKLKLKILEFDSFLVFLTFFHLQKHMFEEQI